MRKHFTYLFIVLLLSILSFAQKKGQQAAVIPEAKVPNWVSARPHSGFKYVGIGVADKGRSNDPKSEAKQNALFDLASEIKVDISTNSVLHSVSSNTSFDQSFNSMIKLTNSDNIEGYTMVDSYENDKQYWVYYELDKAEYAKRKEQKKQNTLTKAANLIAASFADEKNKNFSGSLKKRIQAFGILNPYLNEEIVFDPAQSNGIKNVFELTNLIQNQLQSISVTQGSIVPIVKPYQPNYNPIIFKIKGNGSVLNDFPFFLSSDDEYLKIEEHVVTNSGGEMQLKINGVEPQFQLSSVTLNPDIEKLIAGDSVGKASITLLKQFIQTPSLKVQVNIEPISLFILSKESNFDKQLPTNMIEQYVHQKFTGQEIKIIDNIKMSDYVIELEANTDDDISSDVLEQNYKLNLAQLTINVALKNNKGEVLYKNLVTDIFGYANSSEKAGINAYSNNKLKVRLSESLFFMKRKMIIY
jgi:hypothetical protein